MKHMIAATLIVGLVSIGPVGCNEQTEFSTKHETTISTLGRATTITTEKEIKQTGNTLPKATP